MIANASCVPLPGLDPNWVSSKSTSFTNLPRTIRSTTLAITGSRCIMRHDRTISYLGLLALGIKTTSAMWHSQYPNLIAWSTIAVIVSGAIFHHALKKEYDIRSVPGAVFARD